MTRINQRVFAIAANAVEKRSSHLLERYMVTHAINLEACGNVVRPDCRADYSKHGLAGGLFSTWRDAKIEDRLFERYGIKVESLNNPDRSAGAHRFKVTNGNGVEVRLTNGDLEAGNFTGGNRELGREFRVMLREETKWYEFMQRRSVRNYLDRKHGMKLWCFFACKTRDNADLKLADAKTRFKYRFVERFVFPFSGKYGTIMNCVISGGANCSNGDKLREKGLDRGKLSDADIEDITKYFSGKPDGKFSQYIVERLLTKVMGQTAARGAVSAIPVVGQIYLGLVFVDMFDRLDEFIENKGLSRMAADLNSRQYLEYYAVMRSANDETKSHVLSLEDVGAIMTDFDGPHGAEESLVHKAYDSQRGAPFPQSDPPGPHTYTCADGNPIPSGELVCAEKKIKGRTFKVEDWRNNKAVDGVVDALNVYDMCIGVPVNGVCGGARPKTIIHPLLAGIDNIIATLSGPIISGAMATIKAIPGIGSLLSFAENKLKDLAMGFFRSVFPLPIDIDSYGREKRDGLEAGGDVAAAEFGKGGYTPSGEPYGLGAPKLTDSEAGLIMQDYFARQEEDYRSSGFVARLTNREYPYSILNNAIAAIPTNANQLPSRLSSSISSVFANIFNMELLGSFLGRTPVGAQTSPQTGFNAFGITRFGYALDDQSYVRDPGEFTEETCKQIKDTWKSSMAEDEETGFDEYSVANPCLLEQVTIEAAGGWFTDE